MADHYLKSIELLDEAADVRVELDALYAENPAPTANMIRRPADVQEKIGNLQARHRTLLKRAEIHSNLALVQATFEKTIAL